jgi:hypothetical protein
MSRHSDVKHTKIEHPATHYEKPADIPRDENLTGEEKAKALIPILINQKHMGARCTSINDR